MQRRTSGTQKILARWVAEDRRPLLKPIALTSSIPCRRSSHGRWEQFTVYARQYDQAIETCKKLANENPTFAHLLTFLLRPSTGIPGRATCPSGRLILLYSRAGVAGRNTAPGSPANLLVHLISGMQYVTGINEPPKRAMAMGGILRWKDGRNMPDVHSTLFEYGNIPVYMRLNLGTETPEIYHFMGSKGVLELTEFSATYIPQPRVDLSPSYYASGFPKSMREAYFKQWHQEHDSVPGQETALEGISYRSVSWDEVKPYLWSFFQAVRTRKPGVEDAVFGHHAALACHMANSAY